MIDPIKLAELSWPPTIPAELEQSDNEKFTLLTVCPDCGLRATAYKAYPSHPCPNCGENNLTEKTAKWVPADVLEKVKVTPFWPWKKPYYKEVRKRINFWQLKEEVQD